jgi:NAD(P)-dependent dehydrogenase (short-subunit alcohol dehydrogenase family)
VKVLVSGATGALGTAVCAKLCAAGHEVRGSFLLDHEVARFRAAVPQAGVDRVDLGDEGQVAEWFAAAGPADGLVHVAGGFLSAPIERTTLAQLDAQLTLNLRTLFLCAREAVRQMRPRGAGRIVAVGSKTAVDPGADVVAYAASKAGAHALVRGLAEELRGTGIGVYGVLPSVIDTPANRAAMPDADPKRWVSADDIADVVVALVSGPVGVATGALVPVYGR